jgi:bifunctional pyridoxal-dependent enzyme with beta-cystathionase and maltose regulon repressor activities
MQQIELQEKGYLNNLLSQHFQNNYFSLKNLLCLQKKIFNPHHHKNNHKKMESNMETISILQKKESISNYQIPKLILEFLLTNLKNKMKLLVLFQRSNPILQVWRINLLQKLARIIKRDSSILVVDSKMPIL